MIRPDDLPRRPAPRRRSLESTEAYAPSPREVERLIELARKHPLGEDFLRRGAPDAVASTFGVHAFVVDRAREQLD